MKLMLELDIETMLTVLWVKKTPVSKEIKVTPYLTP